MRMILSETNGKFLIENRYPKGKTDIRIEYGWEKDPKASFSDHVKIGDHFNSMDFAKKIAKKVGPCRSVIVALGHVTANWHARIDI